MLFFRYTRFILFVLLCGCKTVKQARHAQSGNDRLAGESTVTASQAGLENAQVVSLAALEKIACDHHPSLLQARQAVASARLQCRMIRSGRLPQISASGAYNRSTQNSWGRSTESEMRGSWSSSLGLDLLLLDFGRLDAEEKQAVEALVAAEEQLCETGLEVAYRVRTSFFERYRSDNLLRVALESERQYAEHLEEARIMTEVGTRRQYDVTKAEVDWGNSRLDVVTVSNNVVVTQAQLNRSIGLAEQADYRIDAAQLPAMKNDPSALLAIARSQAPSLAVLRARERTASAYVDQMIAELYPEFSLGTSADLSGRGFPLVWNFSWALRLVQNIFDGHRKTARIDEAVTQLRVARSRVADAEQALYLNLVSTVAQSESARKRLDIVRLIQKQAQDNLEIVNEQYRVGMSSAIERTDAQVALTQARADVIRAFYDEQAARAGLLRLTGEATHAEKPPATDQPGIPLEGVP